MPFISGLKAKLSQPGHEAGQRSQAVLMYQTTIENMKAEIAVLEAKKGSLSKDLTDSFKERLALVESMESRLKQTEKETFAGVSALNV